MAWWVRSVSFASIANDSISTVQISFDPVVFSLKSGNFSLFGH
jgi:hypothetical protein